MWEIVENQRNSIKIMDMLLCKINREEIQYLLTESHFLPWDALCLKKLKLNKNAIHWVLDIQTFGYSHRLFVFLKCNLVSFTSPNTVLKINNDTFYPPTYLSSPNWYKLNFLKWLFDSFMYGTVICIWYLHRNI